MKTKVPTYTEAIEWIALNDDAGSPNATKLDVVASYMTTALVADLFGTKSTHVAKCVVAYRKASSVRIERANKILIRLNRSIEEAEQLDDSGVRTDFGLTVIRKSARWLDVEATPDDWRRFQGSVDADAEFHPEQRYNRACAVASRRITAALGDKQ